MNISDLHNPNMIEKYKFMKNLDSNNSTNKNNFECIFNADLENDNENKYDKKGIIKNECNTLKNSNIADFNKSRSKNKHLRNSISKENRLSKDLSIQNVLLKKNYEINKPLKNFETKSKFRNRIFDEEKAKKLYNPKLSKNKNIVKVINNKNFDKKEFSEFNSEKENIKRLSDNLKYLAEIEEKLNGRLKIKNKSFSSSNLNWNYLFVTAKSNSYFLAKNNKIQRNKSENKTQVSNIDDLMIKRKSNEFNLKHSDNKNIINNNNDNKTFKKKLTFDYYSDENKTSLNDHENTKTKDNETNFLNKNLISQAISSAKIRDNAVIASLAKSNLNEEIKESSKRKLNEEEKKYISEEINPIKPVNYKLEKQTIEENTNATTNSLIIKTANEKIISERNQNSKSLFDAKRNLNSMQNNIKIFENDLDIQLMDISKYNKLDTEKDLIFNNINATESDQYEEVKFESEFSNCDNHRDSNFAAIEKSFNNNNNKGSYSNFIKNINDASQYEKDNKNLISDLVLDSKESLNNFQNNSGYSDCSKFADDAENMNTLIKRLDFNFISKNVNSVFNLTSKVYGEFNVKFRNEIEGHLFPQR